jgi:hypothetical protein
LDTPYSVHRGLYGPADHRSSTSWSKVGAISAKASETLDPAAIPAGGVCANENAPSRWRLRPASRLTAAEATADRRTFNLGRSVLGASRNLGTPGNGVNRRKIELVAICDFSLRNGHTAVEPACSTVRGEKKGPGAHARPQGFAEPGTLSSTFPTNLPLPRSAPRGASSYRRPVLGAGRNLGDRTCPRKGVRGRKFSLFAQTVQGWLRPDREAVGFRDVARSAIPRSHLWVVPNAGHGPVFGDNAPRFATTALGFLQGAWSHAS